MSLPLRVMCIMRREIHIGIFPKYFVIVPGFSPARSINSHYWSVARIASFDDDYTHFLEVPMRPFSCHVHDIRTAFLFVVLCVSIAPASLFARSTIFTAQSGSWFDAPTWVGGVLPGPADSVMVLNGHLVTVELSGACAALSIAAADTETGVQLVTGGFLNVLGDAYVTSPSTNNLGFLDGCDGTLNVSGNLTLVGGTDPGRVAKLIIASGHTTISGDIIMNNGQSRITFVGPGTLSIGGNLPSIGFLTPAGGTVEYNGTTPQQIAGYTYNNVSINNSAGTSLDSDATVNGTLSLLAGKLTLGAHSMTIGIGGSITGASSSQYIVADGAGTLVQNVNTFGPIQFPIGTANSYDPMSIRAGAGSDNFFVSIIGSVSPPIGANSQCVQRTWVISEGFLGGNGDLIMTFQWNQADEGSMFDRVSGVCWRYASGSWAQNGTLSGISGTDPYIASVSAVTGVGSFTIGNPSAVSVHEEHAVPVGFALKQNYPNPFNPSTRIHFSVSKAEHATLTVFNLLGQEISTLFSGMAEPGRVYAVDFESATLGAGVYVYSLKTASQTETRRMVVLK